MLTRWMGYGGLTLLVMLGGCSSSSEPQAEQSNVAPEVITLTQTGCQFLETESKDYGYKTAKKQDCEGINTKTLEERKGGFKPLTLKPGKYIFKVTNQNVPYELGFWLRGEGLSNVTLPKVSGGGLLEGQTKDYEITLKPGKYVFSCPLNPTPDYPVEVTEA